MPDAQTNVSAVITAKVNGTAEVLNLQNAVRNTGGELDKTTKAQQRFAQDLERLVQTYGKGKAGAMEYRAAQLGLGDAYAAQIAKLRELEAAAAAGGHGMAGFSLKTAGARRELIVMGHEIMTGNWTRFAGSMMVLGERTNLMSLAFSGAGLAIGATAAVVGAFTVAAIQGAMESAKLSTSLQLTGGFAGVSKGQFYGLTQTLGKDLPGGAGEARKALQALVDTGVVGPAAIKPMAAAVLEFSEVSGESADKVAADFAKMSDGVAKWAAEHNKQYHFLTLDQYNYIDALEKTGHVQQAMAAASDDFNAALQKQGEKVGWLIGMWHGLEHAGSSVWDWMKNIGREHSPAEQIADIKGQIADLERLAKERPALAQNFYQPQIDALKSKLPGLELAQNGQDMAAAIRADTAARQQNAIAAQQNLTNLREEIDRRTELSKKLDEYKKWADDLAKAGHPIDAKQRAQDIADITKRFGPKPDRNAERIESAFERERKVLIDERTELQRNIDELTRYGQVKDKSRLATLNANIAGGDKRFAGMSQAQIAELRSLAAGDDALSAEKKDTETRLGIEKKVDALEAEAKAQDKLKGATAEAVLIAEIQRNQDAIGLYQAQLWIQAINAITAAKEKKKLQDALDAEDQKTQATVDKINAETKSLGLNNVERAKAVELAKALDAAQKVIDDRKLTGQAAQDVRDHFTANAQEINAANDAKYAASRTMSMGTKTAFDGYIEQATNGAAQVEQVWKDTFHATDQALEELVTKGKVNFKGLVDSIIMDLLRMEMQEMVIAPIMAALRSMMGFSSFGGGQQMGGAAVQSGGALDGLFANGGIMTSAGALPLPVNAYANGGVANRPQVALYGEGRNPEAYVPLPDGRSIPVTMKGSQQAGGGHTFNTSVVVNGDGSSSVSGADQGRGFAKVIQAAIRQELLNQRRDGGILSGSSVGTG